MTIYSSYLTANSGMGEAARAIVKALHVAGEEIVTQVVPNLKTNVLLDDNLELGLQLNKNVTDYDIKIIHLTPNCISEHFDKHLSPNKYHIFHLFWETDRLPAEWAWALNLCDEIWTGTERDKQNFIKSGVTKPIKVFPQPVEASYQGKELKIRRADGSIEFFNGYLFYSIFQWIERKDPLSLLKAYWNEFKPEEDVGLLIKTYKQTFSQKESVDIINQIDKFKQIHGFDKVPKTFIYLYPLDTEDIYNVHATGDCYVTTDRGEGWGRTNVEALLCGKPLVATDIGGCREYLTKRHFYPLRYKMSRVFNMRFVPWYTEDQLWAQVNVKDLQKKLRFVFSNQKVAKMRAGIGKKFIKREFNYKTVGEAMKARLDDIRKG